MTYNLSVQDVRELAYKRRDAWWTVLLVDPIACRLVKVTANRTNLTPNQLTAIGAFFGFASAILFWFATPWFLVAGAVAFYLSFLLDCMDGKIARIKGNGTILGGWLDYVFDRIRVFACAIGLFGGQYAHNGGVEWIWLALIVVFFDMLRYLDALQMKKIQDEMTDTIARACEEAGIDMPGYVKARVAAMSESENAVLKSETAHVAASDEGEVKRDASLTLQGDFTSKYSGFYKFRNFLMARRIRPHVFSGIEYQMFIFIVAPLVAAVYPPALFWITVASAALLLLFELALVYKFVLSTKTMPRVLADITKRAATANGPKQPTA